MSDVRLDPVLARGIVPVIVIDDVRVAEVLGEVLVAQGLPVAEITLRTPGAVAVIERLSEHPALVVGAGTVLTAAQFDRVVVAGARYVVAPGSSRAVLDAAAGHDVPLLPGAVTATEVMTALDAGHDTLKFFPAETSGGVAALSAFASPFGGVRFVPTGGVGPVNVADYLALPNVPAVGGSWMVPGSLLAQIASEDRAVAARATAGLEDAVRDAVRRIDAIRGLDVVAAG